MTKKLSIFIPTYNRSKKLELLLLNLNKIDLGRAIVHVVDNGSTDDTKVTIERLNPKVDYDIHYSRNNVNIGLSGNILRCIEFCNTEWLWILGDDDKPLNNSVAEIENYIYSCTEETAFINFSTSAMKTREDDIICKGLDSFLNEFDSFSNILFISTSVFNCRILHEYIRFGFLYSYSLSPHLAILLSAMNEFDREVIFSKKVIVDFQENDNKIQKWSYFNLFLGVITLLEIPNRCSIKAYNNFIEKVLSHVIIDVRLFLYLIKYYLDNPILRKIIFNQIILRNYWYLPNKSMGLKIKLIFYWMLVNNDKLLKFYIRFRKIDLRKISYSINIQPINNRV